LRLTRIREHWMQATGKWRAVSALSFTMPRLPHGKHRQNALRQTLARHNHSSMHPSKKMAVQNGGAQIYLGRAATAPPASHMQLRGGRAHAMRRQCHTTDRLGESRTQFRHCASERWWASLRQRVQRTSCTASDRARRAAAAHCRHRQAQQTTVAASAPPRHRHDCTTSIRNQPDRRAAPPPCNEVYWPAAAAGQSLRPLPASPTERWPIRQ